MGGSISMKIFPITDFGAIPDGTTLCTHAIQAAAIACREAGGGVVLVPAGTFLTGTFELFSHTTLQVEAGARLLASADLNDHRVGECSVGLLYAQDAEGITLTGEGILDGNGSLHFHEGELHGGHDDYSAHDTFQRRNALPHGSKDAAHGPFRPKPRPGNMIVLARCRDVRMEHLTITGASYWTIHCADSENLVFEGLNIANDLRHPNNDGIHLTTCRHAVIRQCRIVSGDDCVAITGFRNHGGEREIAFGLSGIAGVGEDIEISDCTFTSRSSAVRIGYGENPVRNIRLKRLDIRESNRGIGIYARQADVEDVAVEDCTIQTRLFHGNWWGRGEPVHVSAVRFGRDLPLFRIRDLTFRDIRAEGETGMLFFAEEPGAIEHVRLIRVSNTLHRGALHEQWGGNVELRPVANPEWSIMAGGNAPLWAVGVKDLHCEECIWQADEDSVLSPEPFHAERVG